MAIAIAYTAATNIAVVTGGTEGVPATMADLCQADFDGTLVLENAFVVASDPDTITLTQPVRAADSRALPLTISVDANRAGATADIIGRDADAPSRWRD